MMVRVLLDDIIYCDYENHYIRIHTARRMVRSYMQFRELSKLLIGYAQFQCCYRNIIINMDQVQEMEHADFLMSNGERIPMRRQERLEIRQKYADIFSRKQIYKSYEERGTEKMSATKLQFTKMQGLGNDYVYVDCTKKKLENASEVAVKVSDRHFGIGSDGLI